MSDRTSAAPATLDAAYGHAAPRLVDFLRAHPPVAVVCPENTVGLSRVLAELTAARIALWPLGAGVHVQPPHAAATRPVRPFAIIDLRALNAVVQVDRQSAMVEVEAGATLPDVDAALRSEGLTISHLGRWPAQATLGGLLGRQQGQPPAFGFPSLLGACVGLRATMAPDTTYLYRPAPRKASGPDLRAFFVGAQGRAGVMTSVWLSAAHLPAERTCLCAELDSLGTGLAVIRGVLARGVRPRSGVLAKQAGKVHITMEIAGAGSLVRASSQTVEQALRENGVGDVEVCSAPPPRPEHVVWEAQGNLEALRVAVAALDSCDVDAQLDAWTPFGARLTLAAPAEPAVVAADWAMVTPERAEATALPGVVHALSSAMGATRWLSADWFDEEP